MTRTGCIRTRLLPPEPACGAIARRLCEAARELPPVGTMARSRLKRDTCRTRLTGRASRTSVESQGERRKGADTVAGLHSIAAMPWTEEYQTDLLQMSHRVFEKGVFTRDRRPKAAAQHLRERRRNVDHRKP